MHAWYCNYLCKSAIMANRNCSTIIAIMAATPLHRLATVQRMIISTYQVNYAFADAQTRCTDDTCTSRQ